MKLENIIKVVNGKLIQGNINNEINTFSIDTRTINKGDVYIGIKGEEIDGGIYYKDAILKGAIGIIVNEDIPLDLDSSIFVIKVKDTLKALQDIATYKRSLYSIPVVAITGSAGKTTTKDMIAKILSSNYKVLKTEGSLNNHLGLPLTILKLKDEDILVVEMGMNHFGEIRTLTNIAKPTVAVITNIGTAHIGRLGSRENILKAKLEILEGMNKDGILVVNNDNDLLHNVKINNKIITVGIKNKSDYIASNIVIRDNSSSYTINEDNITIPYNSEGFIYNSMLAYTVGKIFNINNISDCLKNVCITKGRLEIKNNNNNIIIIDDCYNANMDAVINSLSVLSTYKQRKIAILGSMLDLDGFEEEMHTKVGYEIARRNIDYLILVGKYTNYIKEGAITKGFNNNNILEFNSNDEVNKYLDGFLKPKDVVLVKASHPLHFFEIVNYIMGE